MQRNINNTNQIKNADIWPYRTPHSNKDKVEYR